MSRALNVMAHVKKKRIAIRPGIKMMAVGSLLCARLTGQDVVAHVESNLELRSGGSTTCFSMYGMWYMYAHTFYSCTGFAQSLKTKQKNQNCSKPFPKHFPDPYTVTQARHTLFQSQNGSKHVFNAESIQESVDRVHCTACAHACTSSRVAGRTLDFLRT